MKPQSETRLTQPETPPASEPRRLLAGWVRTHRPANHAAHQAQYGPLPAFRGSAGRDRLIAAVEAAGLRGRGGAWFPTARKLRAVATRGQRAVVLVNACEGEPLSDKDHALLTLAPHLVLDGAELAAHAVGADQIVVCVHRDDPVVRDVRNALAERRGNRFATRIVQVPSRYVASEESALVNFLNTGDARPTYKPPRPFEQGVDRRPTLVDNAETLAHLALVARFGPEWFRGCGTEDSPGTTLVTIAGAVTQPGVYEVALGTPVGRILSLADPQAEPVHAVLVGGFAGGWVSLPNATEVPLTHEDLGTAGAGLGVGSLAVLPAATCGLAETERILRYLAAESAAQCGPCMFGLPAIADDLEHLTLGAKGGEEVRQRLQKRLSVIDHRGACSHPDGAVRLAASALHAFDSDLTNHLAGRPCSGVGRSILPSRRRRSTDWR
jgi:NADH:ubiquinone oxidoreductase subunit F (NADH-binding)